MSDTEAFLPFTIQLPAGSELAPKLGVTEALLQLLVTENLRFANCCIRISFGMYVQESQ